MANLNNLSVAQLKAKIQKLEFARKFAWGQVFRARDIIFSQSEELMELDQTVIRLLEEKPLLKKDETMEFIKHTIFELSKKAGEFLECAICMEPMGNVNLMNITKCSHMFHASCIAQVETNKCPICRCPMR